METAKIEGSFLLANDSLEMYGLVGMGGIVGLSRTNNEQIVDSALHTMQKAGYIDQCMFSFYMSDNETNQPSEIVFGGIVDEWVSPDNLGWREVKM